MQSLDPAWGIFTLTPPPCERGSADQNICTGTVYDPNGNVIQTVDSMEVITFNFYDKLNRVQSTIENLDGYNNETSDWAYFEYEYDAVGNRIRVDNEGINLITVYQYDGLNRLVVVIENSFPMSPADYTKNITTEYTWDNNGNLLDDGTHVYTYDYADRLVSVDGGQSSVSSYEYNGLGDRLSQTVDDVTTNYTLDLASGLTQMLDDGTHTYLYGNMRLAQQGVGGTEYFLTDALGSVRQLVDENGSVTLAQAFQPYGETLTKASVGGASAYGFVACGLGRMDGHPHRIGPSPRKVLRPLAGAFHDEGPLGRRPAATHVVQSLALRR